MKSGINCIRTGPRGRPPVVLVHPVGLDLTYWGAQIELLRHTHDVLAFDLPGHGRSAGNPSDWTIEKATAVLGEVIRSSGANNAHVVGLSVGGMLSQSLAIHDPALVKSLTLIDTAAAFPEEARAGMRERAQLAGKEGMSAVVQSTLERWFTSETRNNRPDIVDRVTKTLLADDPAVHAAMWEMIAALDMVSRLHTISCSTLVLVGEFDPSSPPSAAAILVKSIPNARLHIVANASHMSPLEQPEAINAHLSSFLCV